MAEKKSKNFKTSYVTVNHDKLGTEIAKSEFQNILCYG